MSVFLCFFSFLLHGSHLSQGVRKMHSRSEGNNITTPQYTVHLVTKEKEPSKSVHLKRYDNWCLPSQKSISFCSLADMLPYIEGIWGVATLNMETVIIFFASRGEIPNPKICAYGLRLDHSSYLMSNQILMSQEKYEKKISFWLSFKHLPIRAVCYFMSLSAE